ncbi:MAG: hypothetical protein JXR77_00675, partial [Lentisphaeria bacterium]|nr:hypothetical protein [Lentisphaeria bacterium]
MVVYQNPPCGKRLVCRRGDAVDIRLKVDRDTPGEAFVRCNLGREAIRRREVVAHTENFEPILARDWHDIPMQRTGAGTFRAVLPLTSCGLYEAKAFFLPGKGTPVWPAGGNILVKVEPDFTAGCLTVYTLFPRQFAGAAATHPAAEVGAAEALLDGHGYTVIPASGTFRDVVRRLDTILGVMGFRVVQLLPIHPVPTTFARMGRFGSPFAARDFLAVDPALGEFDRRATPMEQFQELLDAVHAYGAFLYLDIPANHTGWASILQQHHPEWFCRQDDGTFVNPGAWGVVWEDLCKLDYRRRELWTYLAEVFLHWCRIGVDGFRCDAGYMLPVEVWQYITAKVRQEFPDTVFLLEGLGGPLEVTEALLAEGGLNWAYSELFQSFTAGEISRLLEDCIRIGRERGVMVHFAETHDNDRLASVSRRFSRFRCALCALVSDAGAFGITNGVEWYAEAKLDVHGAGPLGWGNADNQVDHLASLNRLLAEHPAFHAGADLRLVATGAVDTVGVLRAPRNGPEVLVLANVHETQTREVSWPPDLLPGEAPWVDLLSGHRAAVH